jgi:hypothetical protein
MGATQGLEPSTRSITPVLTQLFLKLFAHMERHASVWLSNWWYTFINMKLNLVIFQLAESLEQVLVLGGELLDGGNVLICNGL